MKDEKGLTYIATIILVIIIIAFAIGVILYIQQQYRNEESETIKTNMLAIQGKAKMVAEEEKALKKELIGTKILIEQQDQKVKDFLKSQNIEIEENSKYYILKKEDLTTMGLSNINIEPNEYYIVNYDNMEVLYTKGIKVGDNEYYKLSDFNNLSDEKEIVKDTATPKSKRYCRNEKIIFPYSYKNGKIKCFR